MEKDIRDDQELYSYFVQRNVNKFYKIIFGTFSPFYLLINYIFVLTKII